MTKRRKAGIAGAVVGAASAGTAAAMAAKRYAVGRIRLRPDPEAGEPLGELSGRPVMVTTDDGVELYAELDGPERAPLTVVFVHGFCLNLDAWHYQRAALRDSHRLVFYDQRCHGQSGRGVSCSIDRLGEDLAQVIDRLVPGPCVLVGHSMGGMAIMALADGHPELFGRRGKVKGVGLINTSAGKVAEITLGLPLTVAKAVHRVMRPAVAALGRRSALVERTRHAGRDVMFLSLRRLGFGDPKNVSPTLVDFTETMIRATPIDVIADFYPALMDHEKLAALDVLDGVATTIIAGESDWLTPVEHSRAMAEAVPGAELLVVPSAGHLVCLERADAVNHALHDLLDRAGQRRRWKRSA